MKSQKNIATLGLAMSLNLSDSVSATMHRRGNIPFHVHEAPFPQCAATSSCTREKIFMQEKIVHEDFDSLSSLFCMSFPKTLMCHPLFCL